ncbi:MAG: fumarylacetoacetate hydrolase family protein [Bacteroidota bacterium]
MKIICVGRNYACHAKELNNDIPTEPILFMKPESSVIRGSLPFFIPDFSNNVHYECELVLKICKLGKHISEKFAHTYYDEIGLGIDFTARDMQQEYSKNGLPWEKAKSFDGSAFVGKFVQKNTLPNPVSFYMQLNGNTVQQGISSDLFFSFDHLIADISKYFTLKEGDLIFTGTPAGVGPVKDGDILEGFLEGKKMFTCRVK